MSADGQSSHEPTGLAPRRRADLHCHTCYSPDSETRPEEVVAACLRRGIDCLAVTDHNAIEGARRVAALAPFRVIVGEEVRSDAGEIIGYFLEERVPPGLSAREAVARIKAQGGIVCVPHPFDRLRGSRLKPAALAEILPEVDVLEVVNARIHLSVDLRRAERFAGEQGLAVSAGSDAHLAWEIGGAWVDMPAFAGPEGFLASLRAGTPHGRPVTPLVHLASTLSRLRGRLREDALVL